MMPKRLAMSDQESRSPATLACSSRWSATELSGTSNLGLHVSRPFPEISGKRAFADMSSVQR